MRDNGIFENWDMVLIETLNCQDRLEALKKERELIEDMKPSWNQWDHAEPKKSWKNHRIKQNERKKQARKDNPEKYRQINLGGGDVPVLP